MAAKTEAGLPVWLEVMVYQKDKLPKNSLSWGDTVYTINACSYKKSVEWLVCTNTAWRKGSIQAVGQKKICSIDG